MAGPSDPLSDDLPVVLRDPPWRRKKKPAASKTVPVMNDLPVIPYTERVLAMDEEKRSQLLRDTAAPDERDPPEEIAALEEALTALSQKKRFKKAERINLYFPTFDDEAALHFWNDFPARLRSTLAKTEYMLARFGERAIPGAVEGASEDAVGWHGIELCDTPRGARFYLRSRSMDELIRDAGDDWFERYPEAGIIGLWQIALGQESEEKSAAVMTLRSFAKAKSKYHDLVHDVARRFGPALATATAAVLGSDPLLECPVRAPKISPFVKMDALPPLRLKSGKPLPKTAVGHAVEMLQFSPARDPYAGLLELRRACDQDSLDDFLWALIKAWIKDGKNLGKSWPVYAAASLGGDRIAHELAALVVDWEYEHTMHGKLGIEVLARMDSDMARMYFCDVHRTARERYTVDYVNEWFAGLVKERGTSPEALVDDALPKSVSADPKRRARDLDAIEKSVSGRLELAMVEGHRWSSQRFRALFIDHPLMPEWGRRLVFGVFEGDVENGRPALASFRYDEDGALTDAEGRPYELTAKAFVGVVHPVELTDAERASFRTTLAERKMKQLFPQIDRPVFSPTADEVKERSFTRFAGRSASHEKFVKGFERRGYYGRFVNTGIAYFEIKARGGSTVWFEPPIDAGAYRDQRVIKHAYFGKLNGEANPVLFSEVALAMSVVGG